MAACWLQSGQCIGRIAACLQLLLQAGSNLMQRIQDLKSCSMTCVSVGVNLRLSKSYQTGQLMVAEAASPRAGVLLGYGDVFNAQAERRHPLPALLQRKTAVGNLDSVGLLAHGAEPTP